MCGGCRLPRQHKPTCKFKRLPFSAPVYGSKTIFNYFQRFLLLFNQTTSHQPVCTATSSNLESLGLDSKGDNYDELVQEDDAEEENVDRTLNDILSDYSLRITLSP